MGAQLELAKHRVFDKEGLNASNLKLFPGSSRDATAEQMAAQVTNAIAQIEAGDYEEIDSFED